MNQLQRQAEACDTSRRWRRVTDGGEMEAEVGRFSWWFVNPGSAEMRADIREDEEIWKTMEEHDRNATKMKE